jgi:hypothetical protein
MATPIEPDAGPSAVRYFIDWGKLFTLALVLGFTLVLALVGTISEAFVTTVMGAVIGYTFGNGAQARKGLAPAPIIGSTTTPRPAPDNPGSDPA